MSDIRIDRLELRLPRQLAGGEAARRRLAQAVATALAGQLAAGVKPGVAPPASVTVQVPRRQADAAGIARAIGAAIAAGGKGD